MSNKSKFPPNAKKPLNMSNEIVNPAEHHVSEEQKEQALAALQKIGNAFKNMGGGTKSGDKHEPIMKSLDKMGITVHFMPVMVGDEPTDCVVIPVSELIVKEYQYMTGVNITEMSAND